MGLRGVKIKITKIQRQSRAPWWHCTKKRLWRRRIFYWTGLVCALNDYRKGRGCYCNCQIDGQAADAVTAYTQVKLEDAPRLLKIPKSECPDVWMRLPRHKWPKSWASSWRSCWASRAEFVRSPASWPLVAKTNWRGLIESLMGKSTELGMYVRSSKTRVISVSKCGWHQNDWKEAGQKKLFSDNFKNMSALAEQEAQSCVEDFWHDDRLLSWWSTNWRPATPGVQYLIS